MILRILLIILAVWILRRFLAAMLGNRKSGTPKKTSNPEKNMVKDPICGMYMDPRLAVKHEIKNGIFYFCSETCKNKFLDTSSGEGPDTPLSEK